MDQAVIQALRRAQKVHLKTAIVGLYNYSLYAHFDSSLAVDGEIDSMIKQLERIYEENYGAKRKWLR